MSSPNMDGAYLFIFFWCMLILIIPWVIIILLSCSFYWKAGYVPCLIRTLWTADHDRSTRDPSPPEYRIRNWHRQHLRHYSRLHFTVAQRPCSNSIDFLFTFLSCVLLNGPILMGFQDSRVCVRAARWNRVRWPPTCRGCRWTCPTCSRRRRWTLRRCSAWTVWSEAALSAPTSVWRDLPARPASRNCAARPTNIRPPSSKGSASPGSLFSKLIIPWITKRHFCLSMSMIDFMKILLLRVWLLFVCLFVSDQGPFFKNTSTIYIVEYILFFVSTQVYLCRKLNYHEGNTHKRGLF